MPLVRPISPRYPSGTSRAGSNSRDQSCAACEIIMALPIWAPRWRNRLSLFLHCAAVKLPPRLPEPFPRCVFQLLRRHATFPPCAGLELSRELFVQYLATYSYRHGSGKEEKALTYNDLSNTAEESETFQFLADILPKKILASKYLKMLKEKREEDEEEEDDNSDESDDEAES